MTTTQDDTTTDVFQVSRPQDVPEARWKALQVIMTKVATGHYPWCNDHQHDDSGDDGYCRHTQRSRVGDVVLTNGTLDGVPLIYLYTATGDIQDLSVDEASLLGFELMGVARMATDTTFITAAKS